MESLELTCEGLESVLYKASLGSTRQVVADSLRILSFLYHNYLLLCFSCLRIPPTSFGPLILIEAFDVREKLNTQDYSTISKKEDLKKRNLDFLDIIYTIIIDHAYSYKRMCI